MRTYKVNIAEKLCACPTCGEIWVRHVTSKRTIKHTVGIIEVTTAKYYCKKCGKFFMNEGADVFAPKFLRYSYAILRRALRMHLVEGVSLMDTAAALTRETKHRLAATTIHEWIVAYSHLVDKDVELREQEVDARIDSALKGI